MNTNNFVERLRISKKTIIRIIKEVQADNSLVKRDIWHDLFPILYHRNPRLKNAAKCTYAKLLPRWFFRIKIYPSEKQYCSALKDLVREIDLELDYEKNVYSIAEQLSQIKVSWPNGDTAQDLEEKIHEKASEIARIIS